MTDEKDLSVIDAALTTAEEKDVSLKLDEHGLTDEIIIKKLKQIISKKMASSPRVADVISAITLVAKIKGWLKETAVVNNLLVNYQKMPLENLMKQTENLLNDLKRLQQPEEKEENNNEQPPDTTNNK